MPIQVMSWNLGKNIHLQEGDLEMTEKNPNAMFKTVLESPT